MHYQCMDAAQANWTRTDPATHAANTRRGLKGGWAKAWPAHRTVAHCNSYWSCANAK